MAVPGDGASGILCGHGVAFALAAIFCGMALVVAYAASNGAIFGMSEQPEAAGGAPADRVEPSVTSRDSFEGSANAPAQDTTETQALESSTALTEDQRELLAMRDFRWDSVARQYVSDQDLMNRFKEPASVEPDTEPLSVSDTIIVEISRDKSIDEALQEMELADIDIDLPIDSGDEELEEDEQPEEEDQNGGEDSDANDEGPDGGSGNSSGPDRRSDQSGSGGDSGSGNNTDSEEPPVDSDSGGDNSTSTEAAPAG